MGYRWLHVLLVSFFLVAAAVADQSCEVPVDVVAAKGGIIRGLKPDDLVAAAGKGRSIPIQSLTYDAGPRRIVFVIDTTRGLPAEARKAESKIAANILDHARPNDSFALITARGVARQVKFEQGHDAVKQAVLELGGDLNEKSNNLGVLDAMDQAISWLGAPQPGDSIFLLALDLEGNHKASYKKIAQALAEHQVRLFTMDFGFVNLGNSVKSRQGMFSGGLGTAEPLAGDVLYETGEQNVYPLSINSGGYLFAENSNDPHHEFKLTDPHLQRLNQIAMQF